MGCCSSKSDVSEPLLTDPDQEADAKQKGKVRINIFNATVEQQGGDSYVLYHIQLLNHLDKPLWVIKRRYDDFPRLYASLKQRIPETRLPPLPQKKYFGTLQV
jgi:hypothetical protein